MWLLVAEVDGKTELIFSDIIHIHSNVHLLTD